MLKIGMHLTVGAYKYNYRTKILELSNNKLYISYPVNENTGKTAYFIDINKVIVSFVSEEGNVYKFEALILGRKTINNVPVLIIERPPETEYVKVQRRDYFRVDLNLDVIITPKNHSERQLITTTKDISGGGFAAYGSGKESMYKPHDEVTVLIVLPFNANDYYYVKAKAEVRRIIYEDNERGGILTFKFTQIDDYTRDKIIKFCFDKQLENRKKLNLT